MKYLKLPVDIIQYAFKERKVPQLRLWCYYKLTYPTGFLKKSQEIDESTMEQLNIKSPKTLNRHKQKLFRWNWMGYDPISQQYFMRSYIRIKLLTDSRSRLCACLYLEYLWQFRTWCAAAVIGSIIIWSKSHRRAKLLERGERGRLKAGPYPSFPLSNYIIADALGLSLKQASNYKNDAEKANFIGIERNQFAHLGLSPGDLKLLRIWDPQLARKMRIRDGQVLKQLPDKLFICQLEFTRSCKKRIGKKGKHI